MARFLVSKRRCAREQPLIRRTFSNGAAGKKKMAYFCQNAMSVVFLGDFFVIKHNTSRIQSASCFHLKERVSVDVKMTDQGRKTRRGVTAGV